MEPREAHTNIVGECITEPAAPDVCVDVGFGCQVIRTLRLAVTGNDRSWNGAPLIVRHADLADTAGDKRHEAPVGDGDTDQKPRARVARALLLAIEIAAVVLGVFRRRFHVVELDAEHDRTDFALVTNIDAIDAALAVAFWCAGVDVVDVEFARAGRDTAIEAVVVDDLEVTGLGICHFSRYPCRHNNGHRS